LGASLSRVAFALESRSLEALFRRLKASKQDAKLPKLGSRESRKSFSKEGTILRSFGANFSACEVQPRVLRESYFFLWGLHPSARLPQSEGCGSGIDSFVIEDDLRSARPLARGKSFGNRESAKCEAEMRGSVVEPAGGKNFEGVARLVSGLSRGVEIAISYDCHRGAIAATGVRRAELHPAPEKFPPSGCTA
jgi:hypothetical protein